MRIFKLMKQYYFVIFTFSCFIFLLNIFIHVSYGNGWIDGLTTIFWPIYFYIWYQIWLNLSENISFEMGVLKYSGNTQSLSLFFFSAFVVSFITKITNWEKGVDLSSNFVVELERNLPNQEGILEIISEGLLLFYRTPWLGESLRAILLPSANLGLCILLSVALYKYQRNG